jgi:hypothetical protein
LIILGIIFAAASSVTIHRAHTITFVGKEKTYTPPVDNDDINNEVVIDKLPNNILKFVQDNHYQLKRATTVN